MATASTRTCQRAGSRTLCAKLSVGESAISTPPPIMPKLIVISRRGALLYESSTRAILGISRQGPASIAPTFKSDIPPTEEAIRKSTTYSRPGPDSVHFQNAFVQVVGRCGGRGEHRTGARLQLNARGRIGKRREIHARDSLSHRNDAWATRWVFRSTQSCSHTRDHCSIEVTT